MSLYGSRSGVKTAIKEMYGLNGGTKSPLKEIYGLNNGVKSLIFSKADLSLYDIDAVEYLNFPSSGGLLRVRKIGDTLFTDLESIMASGYRVRASDLSFAPGHVMYTEIHSDKYGSGGKHWYTDSTTGKLMNEEIGYTEIIHDFICINGSAYRKYYGIEDINNNNISYTKANTCSFEKLFGSISSDRVMENATGIFNIGNNIIAFKQQYPWYQYSTGLDEWYLYKVNSISGNNFNVSNIFTDAAKKHLYININNDNGTSYRYDIGANNKLTNYDHMNTRGALYTIYNGYIYYAILVAGVERDDSYDTDDGSYVQDSSDGYFCINLYKYSFASNSSTFLGFIDEKIYDYDNFYSENDSTGNSTYQEYHNPLINMELSVSGSYVYIKYTTTAEEYCSDDENSYTTTETNSGIFRCSINATGGAMSSYSSFPTNAGCDMVSSRNEMIKLPDDDTTSYTIYLPATNYTG